LDVFSVTYASISLKESEVLKVIRNRKGQGLVEYALIIAGVVLICAVGMSIFGHKVSDMINTVAIVLPGGHADDNGPVISGRVIETTPASSGQIMTDYSAISARDNTPRLMDNVWGTGTAASADPDLMVPEPNGTPSDGQ
jgi:hypothetical protein